MVWNGYVLHSLAGLEFSLRKLVALSMGECGTHPWVMKIKEQDRVIMTVGVGLHVVEL